MLGARVARLTLLDPVVVSILRVPGEEAALAEMEAQYQRFMDALPDQGRGRARLRRTLERPGYVGRPSETKCTPSSPVWPRSFVSR